MEPTRFWLEIHTNELVQDGVADAYADEHFPVQWGWSMHEVIEDGDEYRYIFHSNTDPSPSLNGLLQWLAPETLKQCLQDIYTRRRPRGTGYARMKEAIEAEVNATHRTEDERARFMRHGQRRA
jgi:hypothetical protein